MNKKYKLFSSAVIHELLDAEVIVANLDNGAYYSLQGSAALAWQLLVSGRSPEAIAADAAQKYGLTPQNFSEQVDFFASQLCQEKLLTVDEDSAGRPVQSENFAWPETWNTPLLEKYEEMKDLLMLDPIHEVDEQGWPHRPSR
jgi:hypothetical protein